MNQNLATAVARETAQGWRIESQTENQVVMVKGKPTSHVLHFLWSCCTLGVWLFVWPIVAYSNRRRVLILADDGFGNMTRQVAK